MSERPDTHPLKYYKRFIRRIVLSVIILLVVSHLIWGTWAAHRLKKTLATLHAIGEPIDARELKIVSVPDPDNASLDYRAAGESVNTNTPAWKTWENSDSGSFRLPLNASEQETIRSIIAANQIAMRRVDAARGKPAGGWKDPVTIATIFIHYDLNSARALSNLLRLASLESHVNDDDRMALQHLDGALAASDAAEYRPYLIGHLLALSMTANASEAISQLAPEFNVGARNVVREQVVSLIHHLQNESAMDQGKTLGLQSERIAILNTMHGLTDGTFSLTALAGNSPSIWSARIEGYLLKPMVLSDESLYATYVQQVKDAQIAPDWPTAKKREPVEIRDQIKDHLYLHIVLGMLGISVEKASQVDYSARSARRLATIALAARLFAADHNDQLPKSLDNLVPAYLPAIPIDAMTGTPLRYKSDPPRIYGLGDDGVDYGGVPQDPESTDKVRRHHGDNVVYLLTQPRKPVVRQ